MRIARDSQESRCMYWETMGDPLPDEVCAKYRDETLHTIFECEMCQKPTLGRDAHTRLGRVMCGNCYEWLNDNQ